MNRHFFHIDFLNESETEELCKQKLKVGYFVFLMKTKIL